MKENKQLEEILDDLSSVYDFEYTIINGKVTLTYSNGEDVFPSLENAVYSFREVMEDDVEKSDDSVWSEALDLVVSLEDKLTSIKASDNGKEVEIYGYADDTILIRQYGLLERVCRDGCNFKEIA